MPCRSSGSVEALIVAYLHSNFLCKELRSKDIWKRTRQLVPAEALEKLGRKRLARLFRYALGLNPAFRLVTTGLTFKVAGYEGSIFDLTDFEFMEGLEEGRRWRQALGIVVDLFEHGVGSAHAARLSPGPSLGSAARRDSRLGEVSSSGAPAGAAS
jgi:hypothetical protein